MSKQLQISVSITPEEAAEIERVHKKTGETRSNLIRASKMRPLATGPGGYRDLRGDELPDFSSKE